MKCKVPFLSLCNENKPVCKLVFLTPHSNYMVNAHMQTPLKERHVYEPKIQIHLQGLSNHQLKAQSGHEQPPVKQVQT